MSITEFRGKYAFLSNFSPSPMEGPCGKSYPTAEHVFQALKTDDDDEREAIRMAETPAEAKALGRKVKLVSMWDEVKLAMMFGVVMKKFGENEKLKQKLLDTGTEYLEEANNHGDDYWGTVGGKGQNQLGNVLMIVRSFMALNVQAEEAMKTILGE